MRLWFVPLLVVLSVAAGGCTKKSSPEGEHGPILIGHVSSMTGPEATFGVSTDRGIRLAVAERNVLGGIKGRRLTVKTLDAQGRPEEAAVAATRLIAQDRVTLLLGEVASTRSLAMAPIADRYQVPMVTPSSTNPKVTKDGNRTRPFVFRTCFIDSFQGTVMARFARETLGLGQVAVLRDVGNDYSKGLADFFVSKFKELGGTIVGDLSYKAGDQDFKAQLTSLRGKNPQGIYVPGYYTDVALIVRQARELNLRQTFMGGDGWDSPRLFEIGGAAIEGSHFTNHYSPEDPGQQIQAFVAKYRAAHGEQPDSLAATGYDAARVAIDAMIRAPDLSGKALQAALAETKGFAGVTGVIALDQHHNAVKPAVILKVTDGAARYVATVNP